MGLWLGLGVVQVFQLAVNCALVVITQCKKSGKNVFAPKLYLEYKYSSISIPLLADLCQKGLEIICELPNTF